jgi:hypothetical protein
VASLLTRCEDTCIEALDSVMNSWMNKNDMFSDVSADSVNPCYLHLIEFLTSFCRAVIAANRRHNCAAFALPMMQGVF